MENADSVQDLFDTVGRQLVDPKVDITVLRANLHELVRSGHVCASPIAVRVLCELLTNERLCKADWPLAHDYASIAFSKTDTPAVNDTIDEIVVFRDYARRLLDRSDEKVELSAIPKWLVDA